MTIKNKSALLVAATCATLALSMNVNAETSFEKHKNELVGFSTGAAIGGLVANVPGAFAGGFIGALLAQTKQNSEELIALKQGNTQLANNEVVNLAVNSTVESLKQGMTVDFNFRTASNNLNDRDEARLAEVAGFLNQFPALKVQLDGYADIRGNEAYNLGLSKERLGAVKQHLVKYGIEAERIVEVAHGKSDSVERDHDGYAFERRVSLMLSPEVSALAKQEVENESLA